MAKVRKNISHRRRTYSPARSRTPVELAMGKKAVAIRHIPPNVGTKGRGSEPLFERDPVESLSELERLAIQLDLSAQVPLSAVAKKHGLSIGQVRRVGKEQLNLTGQMRVRLESIATVFAQHAGKMLGGITDEKIAGASLPSLNLAAAIAVDKAVQIDKHLHGTEDRQGDLVVSFGSREALERALIRKFKQSPLFKAMTQGEVTKPVEARVEEVRTLPGQLDLFPGTEENRVIPEKSLFAGKEVMASSLLRRARESRSERARDQEIEKGLDESW